MDTQNFFVYLPQEHLNGRGFRLEHITVSLSTS